MNPSTLNDWLRLLEKRHPREIDLGLQRIRQVAEAMHLGAPAKQVVIVAGTNGKGSCVNTLYQLALHAGLRVAAYTSPHLLTFNERISINGKNATDENLCEAFQRIENARGEISLTYFEFATLAALLLMAEAELDLAILEVGLGGRLDAVNMINADIAIVTSIALDHQDWLGSDLTQIAREKLAVGRSGKPMILGEAPVEVDIESLCQNNNLNLLRKDEHFMLAPEGTFHSQQSGVRYQNLCWGTVPETSVACALEAWQHLRLPENAQFDPAALASKPVNGRFQLASVGGKTLVFDVAHNPAAAVLLAKKLQQYFPKASITAVFAVMADKDIEGIIAPLQALVTAWLLPELTGISRAAKPAEIMPLLYNARPVSSVGEALTKAVSTTPCEVVLVCGSFFTVGPALQWLQEV